MPRLRIPLFGSYVNRNIDPESFSGRDQQFVNGYPEVVSNPLSKVTRVYFNKRPGSIVGSALTSVSAAGAVGAIVAWTGNTAPAPPVAAGFRNVGSSTSVWDLANGSKIGGDIADTTDCLALTETMVSTTANLVGYFYDLSAASAEQWYFPQGGAWTQVTDGDFPTDCVGFPAHMDGYVFNMTNRGRIYNSDLNTVDAYTPTNFITANLAPDKGVTVARHGPHIIAFGEKSIERFYNAGNAFGSPLARVADGGLNMGAQRRLLATGHQTVLLAHGTIYWIGTNSEGATTGIYRFNGSQPEKVSNPGIDKLLASNGGYGLIGSLNLHGLRHIAIQGDEGVFCYCVEADFWWELLLASGEMSACLGVSNTSEGNAKTYFIGSNNARSNEFLVGVTYQDNSAEFSMTVQTENIDAGVDRMKFWKSLRFICDRQTSGSIGVAWSDDDFQNFTSVTNIDITSNQSWIRRLGASRRRSWRFTHSSNTACRIEAVEIEYEVGSH